MANKSARTNPRPRPAKSRRATGRESAAALFAEAVARHQAGRIADADALYRQVLACEPDHPEAHCNLGVALRAQRRPAEAIAAYRRALALRPDYAQAHFNLGNALKDEGRLPEATAAFERAAALNPQDFVACNNLGNVLKEQGRIAEAIATYGRALSLNAGYVEAHANLAVALRDEERHAEAVSSCRRALALRPDHAAAHRNLGGLLRDQGRLTEARASFQQALALDPGDAGAHANFANLLVDEGRADAAAESYQRALALQPHDMAAHSGLLMSQHYRTDISPAAHLAEALRFGERFDGLASRRDFPNDRTPARRLRIGYVSGDFREHPVGYFLPNALEAHDRRAVQIFCYANDAKVDAVTERLKRATDGWRAIAGMADAEAAALIAQDEIDILVDLSGHTAKNRLRLFALRPAPVQASWLGYFGTTGLAAIDYLVMDATAVQPGEERWYREAIARLPHGRFCYAPPRDAPAVAPPPSRLRGHVTFGSFNNLAKLNAHVVRLWAEVLNAVPDARLVLKWRSLDDEGVRRRLADAFTAAGVAEGRLELRGFSPHLDMLAQYADIDIALDPLPFGGGLTSCEALWMGAPIVTLAGDRPAGRQTAAFLDSIGFGDGVARSLPEYVARAAALAADPVRLADMRAGARQRMARSPLCDGALFAPALEAAFRQMWIRWCAGEPARSFDAPSPAGAV